MSGLHLRSIVQTAVLLVILGLAQFSTVFESTTGQVLGGLVLLIVGIDVVWLTWRRIRSDV